MTIKPLLFLTLLAASFLNAFEIDVLSESPNIVVIHHFLSDLECDYLIKIAKPHLQRSAVVGDKDGSNEIHTGRTSRGMFVPSHHFDPILTAIEERISAFTGIPKKNGEEIQILHYKTGGEYKPHYDYFDPKVPGQAIHLQRGGQRRASFLMYLNTPKEGGETVFPLLYLSVTPEKGKALLFYDCDGDGNVDTRTLHGGAPVIKGRKWLATRWFRQSSY